MNLDEIEMSNLYYVDEAADDIGIAACLIALGFIANFGDGR